MDLTDTIVPKSDQLNAEDLLTGPRTVTITDVRKGSAEQPVDIHLAEFPGRPFKPSKTVRRILVAAWGADASAYTGRRMTLYRDAAVKFGGMDVGGIRVSALSDIAKPLTTVLAVSKGKRAQYVVKVLADAPAPTQQPVQTPAKLVEALIENAQEARDNADLDQVARSAAGLTGADLDAVKAVVTARRAELKEAAEPQRTARILPVNPPDEPDGWPETATIPGTDAP